MSVPGNTPATAPAMPDDIEHYQVWPPNRTYITLSEALSWIAFRHSTDCDALEVRLNADDGAAGDRHRRLEQALANLLDHGRSGAVAFVGKRLRSASEEISSIPTVPISAGDLLNYGQFDIFSDGLRFGSGFTWVNGSYGLSRAQQVSRDRFHSVQVDRASVLTLFPPDPNIPPLSNGDEVGSISWSDYGEEALPRLQLIRDRAMGDEWWSWPEALAWVGSRDPANIATLRYHATEWSTEPDQDVVLGTQHFMAGQWCELLPPVERDLHESIERGSVATLGRSTRDSPALRLAKETWRGGKVVYSGGSALVSAKRPLTAWAFDIAVHRADLMRCFPAEVDNPGATEQLGETCTAGDEPSSAVAPTRTGDPGRPPKGYHLYTAEHNRRCDAGEAKATLADEALFLAQWYTGKYPNADPVSPKTIGNRVRARHREYIAGREPQ